MKTKMTMLTTLVLAAIMMFGLTTSAVALTPENDIALEDLLFFDENFALTLNLEDMLKASVSESDFSESLENGIPITPFNQFTVGGSIPIIMSSGSVIRLNYSITYVYLGMERTIVSGRGEITEVVALPPHYRGEAVPNSRRVTSRIVSRNSIVFTASVDLITTGGVRVTRTQSYTRVT